MKPYAKGKKFSGSKVENVIPDNLVEVGLRLIADLIGDPDANQIARYALRPQMLPQNLKFEATMLRLICEMASRNITPSAWTLEERLKYDYPNAHELLVSFMDKYRSNPPVARMHAFNLNDWIERRNMLEAAQKAVQIFAGNVGISQQAYSEAMSVMMDAAPRLAETETATATEALRGFELHNQRMHELWKSGTPLGLGTPWASLNERTGYHLEGDMWTWMAKSKHGKSTVALHLAYHFLLTHSNDAVPYDIGYYHLESTITDLESRYIASQIDLPLKDMHTIVVPAHPKTRNAHARVKQKIVEASKKAELEYVFCPGISFANLVSTIADRKAQADARGRKYVAIIDYYQEIDGSEMGFRETEQYNKMASELKNAFQSLGVYGHVFAQYNIDSKYDSKMTSWNGSKLQMRSQVVIRIERDYDTEEKPTQDIPAHYPDGKPATDIIGNPIYFQRKGNVSASAKFNVLMANGDGGGNPGAANMVFVNDLYQIHPLAFSGSSSMPKWFIQPNPMRQEETSSARELIK